MILIFVLVSLALAQIELNDTNFEEIFQINSGGIKQEWFVLIYDNSTDAANWLDDWSGMAALETKRDSPKKIGQLNYLTNPETADRLEVHHAPQKLYIRKNRVFNVTTSGPAKDVRTQIGNGGNIKTFASRKIPEILTTTKWLLRGYSQFVLNQVKHRPFIFVGSFVAMMFLLLFGIIFCTGAPEKRKRD